MPKELVISASTHETRVAILEDGQLCEIYIEREKEFALVGSIYKGRVTRVLPGMQSAFVDIGLDSDAFLYVGDFFENLEDYDHVVTSVEGKVEKMEQQGGAVFAAPPLVPLPVQPLSEQNALTDQGTAAELVDELPAVQPESNASPALEPPRGFRPPPRFNSGQQGRPPQGGQGFNRGDRGGSSGGPGGRRRGGRFRGGRGNDRRPNRGDLPSAKYASPRPPSPTMRPYEPPSESEPAANFEMVLLPGESLAKYRDRGPGAPPSSAPPASPSSAGESGVGLPSSLYAPSGASTADAPVREDAREIASSEAPAIAEPAVKPDAEIFSDYQALPEEPPLTLPGAPRTDSDYAAAIPVLSDEDVTSLAEQLAEARHEEAAAEAEAEHVAGLNLDEAGAAAHDEAHDAHDEAHDDADMNGNVAALDEAAADSDELAALQMGAPGEAESEISEAEPGEYGNAAAEPGTEGAGSGPDDPPQPTSARVSDPQRARFQRPMRRGGRYRGNRPQQNRPQDHRRPQAPRRPQLISEMLKAGQEIIVQIAKEPLGKKGARITSHVALPGRFLVYMPTVNHIGVSRRIASAEERSRLRHLLTEAKATFPGGFIVRTAAEGAPDDEIRADVEFLGRTWEKIRTQSEPRKSPALLHRDLNLVERILRDYVSNDYTAIWIDNEEEFSKVTEFVSRFQPALVHRVKLYTKPAPIFEEFGIQQELDRALRPKVWLKSGGYIVINHTEALVAIDVNTGKYVGRGSTRLEDTIVKTNLEAVNEIVRQIRLRDLGGIIILDFIDMEERRNREKVMSALDSALRADRAPSKVLPFNEFGLVAVTRKRTKQALERVLCQPCPYCTGSGMVKSLPTICYEIQAEARKMAADLDATSITLRVHPEIAKALKTREAGLIDELEQATRKSMIIQADPTLHWEQYDIY